MATKTTSKTAAKTAARKTTVKKAAPARKTAARKTTAKKAAPARKAAAKKTARKTVARKTTARKTTARKTTARKTVARKAPARKVALDEEGTQLLDLQHLRANRQLADVPTLLLSTRTEDELRLRGFTLGPKDYLLRAVSVPETTRQVD